MACSEILADLHVVGEWQITGRRRHPVAPDNHSSVVKRSIVFKNIDQKLTADHSVDLDSGSLDLLEWHVALNYDQRTCLHLRHLKCRLHDLIDRPVGESGVLLAVIKGKPLRNQILASKLFERLSHLRLEDNYQRHHSNTSCPLHEP